MDGYIGGLEDDSLELFENKQREMKVIYKSRCMGWNMIPVKIKHVLSSAMEADVTAVKSLRRDFGLTNIDDQLLQYSRCNFRGLDGIADLTVNGVIKKEIHNCPKLLTCKAAFKVCAPIVGVGGQLTKSEMKVYFLVCQGLLDKEIALASNTTSSTVETQLKNIRAKLGINNRVEIILHAVQNNISFAPTFN